MLKKGLKRKIFIFISIIFIIFIIYLFPTKKQTTNVTQIKNNKQDTIIYLKDQNNYLGRVSIYLNEKNIENKVKEIIDYLTIKSKNSNYIKNGFSGVIPANTKLISTTIQNDLIILNFSKNFLNIPIDNEEKVISAIIYSLTSIDGIKKISIYVENNLLTKLPNSNIPLPSILDRSFGINNEYNITNYKGTTKTTVYYLSKINDYYYYVPVTIINNNPKDKIEIIITELTSKAIYQTGLISYLNNAKEISYEYDEDIINLNINKKLFNNLNNENLIENIIYSINLSIKENYSNYKVLYLVDNYIYQSYEL